ncbi:hypothetical protein IW262DRAFT_1298793 [Armillaria fumosa]|nr:hypothetical protein IW262DRAFT_1298793 [Armillaria fumosa]
MHFHAAARIDVAGNHTRCVTHSDAESTRPFSITFDLHASSITNDDNQRMWDRAVRRVGKTQGDGRMREEFVHYGGGTHSRYTMSAGPWIQGEVLCKRRATPKSAIKKDGKIVQDKVWVVKEIFGQIQSKALEVVKLYLTRLDVRRCDECTVCWSMEMNIRMTMNRFASFIFDLFLRVGANLVVRLQAYETIIRVGGNEEIRHTPCLDIID